MVSIQFIAGTLELQGPKEETDILQGFCHWDERTRCYRSPAYNYAKIVLTLIHYKIPYEDMARGYENLENGIRTHFAPRPYQKEALLAWKKAHHQGVVVLPTGAGKTLVATLAINLRMRCALVIAPTLDLVRQWYDVLSKNFPDCKCGVIGGGEYQLEQLTVTTYDSAYIHMENIGNRFGLVVFDECHHLPGESYVFAAQSCLAPFRLGLTATPERADGRECLLTDLIGPMVYRRDIIEFSGKYLADYETQRIIVNLSPQEREEYDFERSIYVDFIRSQCIRMSDPSGWNEFVIQSASSKAGRRAMQAYQRQKTIAFAAPAKLEYLEHLLHEHRKDHMIIFTQDNATAYDISKRFLLPTITHKTKVTERSEVLTGFADGTYSAIVTSKVLNEGVDVPEANIAVIMSGSGSVREHVQRLGRILRQKEGKRAMLYELVTAETSETFTSERRRDHNAYH